MPVTQHCARRLGRFALATGLAVGLVALAGCGSSSRSSTSPRVVVSTGIVGAIVREVVGPDVPIEVIIPNGKDPHEFAPSARDIEMMTNAAIVVVNGSGLEAGMSDALAALQPTQRFELAEHVTLRGADPHLWLDPVTVRQAIPALAEALGAAVGRDLSGDARRVATDLDDLDSRIARTIDTIEDCNLVTDHDALAYFAARYGCTIIGSVVPGLSTAGESTASDLADLKTAIARTGVATIFTEANASGDVARAVADDLGVAVVELNVERLPRSDDYGDLMMQLAQAIAVGLGKK